MPLLGRSHRVFGSLAGRIRATGACEGSRGTVSCGMGELSGYFRKVTPLDTTPGVQLYLPSLSFKVNLGVFQWGCHFL